KQGDSEQRSLVAVTQGGRRCIDIKSGGCLLPRRGGTSSSYTARATRSTTGMRNPSAPKDGFSYLLIDYAWTSVIQSSSHAYFLRYRCARCMLKLICSWLRGAGASSSELCACVRVRSVSFTLSVSSGMDMRHKARSRGVQMRNVSS